MSLKDTLGGLKDKFKKPAEKKRPEEEQQQQDMFGGNGGGAPADEPNPFFAGNQEINLEQAEDPNKRGRKLRGKAVVGVIAVVVAIAVGAIASNLMNPTVVKKKAAPPPRKEVGSKSTNPASGIPNNYADLAKYRAEQAKVAREQAEKNAKAKEAVEKTASKEEKKDFKRTPTPPGVPSVANAAEAEERKRAEAQRKAEIDKKNRDFDAKRSAVAFDLGNGKSAIASTADKYSMSGSGKLDTSQPYVLQAGTVIPATLLNGLDTRMSSDVIAQVRQDVFDSRTGQHLLIPQGSRLVGTMGGGNGRRVGVKFSRIIFPDGTSLELPEQRAVDKAGFGGLKDKYDNHDESFFRGAIISGVMSYLSDEVDKHLGNRSGIDHNGNAYGSAIHDTVDKITDRIMDRAEKTEQPNALIRPGFQFNVFVNQDVNAFEYTR